MTNEEYIASGMLELYAAGALSAEERHEVEQRAAGSAAVRAALQEACDTMADYARSYAVPPKPELKQRILARLHATPPAGAAEEEYPVRPMYTDVEQEGSPYKWMFAASIVLFLISGFLSFHFYQKWQVAEQQLSEARASEQQLAQNYQNASYTLSQQEQLLRLLRDEDYKPVKLKGVAAHPGANVIVYWSPQQQKVFLGGVQLPPPPAGKQYQLWALNNGTPTDAGMLSLSGAPSLQQMKQIGAAQAFAVTLEPAGGSDNPTLDQLFVLGNVAS